MERLNLSVFFAMLLSTIFVVRGNPPLQLEVEKPIYPDIYSKSGNIEPNYIMPDYRLPIQFSPTVYTVFLNPHLEIIGDNVVSATASGNVTIEVTCLAPTTNITIHATPNVTINFDSIKVIDANSPDVPLSLYNRTVDEENHIYIIHMANGYNFVAQRNYTISMDFVAPIGGDDTFYGMYYRTYVEPTTGNKKYVILTKLEAIGTRMVFPSFDEPALKAQFHMRLAHTNEYNTICNTPKNRTDVEDPNNPDLLWDFYEPSVKMSTYLLAFVISEYTSVAAPASLYRVPVQTWAAPHLISKGGGIYGANETARIMQFFETRYQQNYPLEKMDSAAIPNFSSGAMEQWGMITYRDDLLLFFEGETTEINRRRISQVIAHELAHQWFGNLVTLAWWDNLWLNEGFANYVEKSGLQETCPEFEPEDMMVSADMQTAFRRDALEESRPVHFDGHNVNEIVYSKAASLIRMMVAFLTEGTFHSAILRYLDQYKYDNAIQDNLFELLTIRGHADNTLPSDLTVKTIMDTWTRQTGFPLIRVSRASTSRIFVSQERFGDATPMIDEEVLDPSELWYVPISYTTAENPDFNETNQRPKFWLAKNAMFTNHAVNTSQWLLVNTDARNFYRVLYDNYFHGLIVNLLLVDPSRVSDANRAQLIDDYFQSAFAGYTHTSNAMDLTRYLETEYKLVVWTSFFNNMRISYERLSSHRQFGPAFKEYFSNKTLKALEHINPEQTIGDRGADVILRAQLLDWACGFNLTVCFDYSKKLFTQWSTGANNVVPVDIQPVIYCAIMSTLPTDAYLFFIDKYENEVENPAHKILYRNALACASEISIITELLNATAKGTVQYNNKTIEKTDALEILKRIMLNKHASEIALDFVSENLNDIIAYHNVEAIGEIIKSLSSRTNEEADRLQIRNFTTVHATELLPIVVSLIESEATVAANMKWMDNFGTDIGNWLVDAIETTPM